MSDTIMNDTISFVVFSLIITSMEDMIKEIPYGFFEV